jgi:hypothetical protein
LRNPWLKTRMIASPYDFSAIQTATRPQQPLKRPERNLGQIYA